MREIDDYYLPAIQREFVWPPEKIEALFDSLLRGYPIGTLLIWDVREPEIHEFTFYDLIRNFDVRNTHNEKVNLANRKSCKGILDGQQRITSLLIGFLGSYTDKVKYRRKTDPNAYPETRLHINLLFQPQKDSPQRFQIKFLSDEQRAHAMNAYWFPFSKILPLDNEDKIFEFRKSTPFRDDLVFEKTINKLFHVVHKSRSISCFLCTEQDLDEVLNIFVRLNTGGVPLSYSDLLLSLATAAWKQYDARESVYKLVNQLNNECGGRFAFSKDFVLKTLLVASDKDVRFKTENIRKRNQLEDIWDEVQVALKTAVRLVASFGFGSETLTAPYALIPIAYYIYKNKQPEPFLSHEMYQQDRETIRTWLLRILLGKVFRGQTDNVLTNIRSEILKSQDSGQTPNGFPAEQIMRQLSAQRNLVFTKASLEQLVDDTEYGDPHAFAVLALIYPHLKYQYSSFHVDHMHPKSEFNRTNLEKIGTDKDDIDFCLSNYNRLPNLQLLPGPVNEAKTKKSFEDWLNGESDPSWHRSTSLIPPVDLSLRNFREFYNRRRQMLLDRLEATIGPTPSAPALEEDTASLVTGDVTEQ